MDARGGVQRAATRSRECDRAGGGEQEERDGSAAWVLSVRRARARKESGEEALRGSWRPDAGADEAGVEGVEWRDEVDVRL